MTTEPTPPELLPIVMFPKDEGSMRIRRLALSIGKIPPDQRADVLEIQKDHNPTDWGVPAAWRLWDEWQAGRLLHLREMAPLVGEPPDQSPKG